MCHKNGCVIIQNNIPGVKHYSNLYMLWYSNNSLDLLVMFMMSVVFVLWPSPIGIPNSGFSPATQKTYVLFQQICNIHEISEIAVIIFP